MGEDWRMVRFLLNDVDSISVLFSGMQLLFLLAYSPDLNPIKEAFSCVKSWLWTNHMYVLRETEGRDCDPYDLIWEAVYTTVTPEKIYGWYHHSDYIA